MRSCFHVVALLAIAVLATRAEAQALGCTGPGVQTLGTYDFSPGDNIDWDFDGHSAYIIRYDEVLFQGDLLVIDFSDPTAPILAGSHPIQWFADEAFEVSGGLALFGSDNNGVAIVDVSDPANIAHVGTHTPGGFVTDIEIVGDKAYLASGQLGFEIVDISDPSAPVLLGGLQYPMPGEEGPEFIYSVDVSGDRAYLANQYGDIKIVDISDPAAPTTLAEKPRGPNNQKIVHVAGDVLYIDVAGVGISIYGAADPSSMSYLGNFSGDGALRAFGDRAFKQNVPYSPTDPIDVYDITDPASPVLLGPGPTGPFAFPSYFIDSIAVKLLDVRVYIFDYNDCLPCDADMTTTGAGTGDPGYGQPDGEITAADINFYVNAWVAADTAIADVTTTGAGDGDPGFGQPDGQVTGADIQFYVNAWIAGCP